MLPGVVLVLIAAVYVGLFLYYIHATIIRQPYWDMYSYIVRYLQYRDEGGVWRTCGNPMCSIARCGCGC